MKEPNQDETASVLSDGSPLLPLHGWLLVALSVAAGIIGAERFQGWTDNLPFLVRIPFGLIGAFSAIGIISLWFGMIWDCWFSSDMPSASKLQWTFLLVLTNMLGALVYYYRVYNRRAVSR
jgi:hypothetical protein